jgi:exodeoxyribonuclease VII small subunit
VTEPKYSKSIKRLEEIIEKIENEEIDVDELSERVKEAVSLLKVCKDKIEKADMEVKRVVDDLGEKGEEK